MAVTLKLDIDTTARINALVTRTGQNKVTILQQLIANGIDHLEDYYGTIDARDSIDRGETAVYATLDTRTDFGRY